MRQRLRAERSPGAGRGSGSHRPRALPKSPFSLLDLRAPFRGCSSSPRLGRASSPASPLAPHFTPVLSPDAAQGPVAFLPPLPGVSPAASADKAPRAAHWWGRDVCRVPLWFHKAGGRRRTWELRQEIDNRHRLWPLHSIVKNLRKSSKVYMSI